MYILFRHRSVAATKRKGLRNARQKNNASSRRRLCHIIVIDWLGVKCSAASSAPVVCLSVLSPHHGFPHLSVFRRVTHTSYVINAVQQGAQIIPILNQDLQQVIINIEMKHQHKSDCDLPSLSRTTKSGAFVCAAHCSSPPRLVARRARWRPRSPRSPKWCGEAVPDRCNRDQWLRNETMGEHAQATLLTQQIVCLRFSIGNLPV